MRCPSFHFFLAVPLVKHLLARPDKHGGIPSHRNIPLLLAQRDISHLPFLQNTPQYSIPAGASRLRKNCVQRVISALVASFCEP